MNLFCIKGLMLKKLNKTEKLTFFMAVLSAVLKILELLMMRN